MTAPAGTDKPLARALEPVSRGVFEKIRVRRAQLHKLSTTLVEEYGAIFIGNVNASALARTRMAKSALDAGWSLFRTMLQYKCDYAGGVV